MDATPAVALVRPPSPGSFETTHLDRSPVDFDEAMRQHAAYREALAGLGPRVEVLAALAGSADAAFVEDTAVVLPDVAIITRPGAPSRREETTSVATWLREHGGPVVHLSAGSLDGGDVLRIHRTLYVGRTSRTDALGIEALRAIAEPLGYEVRALDVEGALHLKTACTHAGRNVLLVNPAWVDASRILPGADLVTVHPGEPFAANCVRVGDRLLMAQASGRTAARVRERGIGVDLVDISQFARMEAGVSCLSLLAGY